jgi:hypothetical protein
MSNSSTTGVLQTLGVSQTTKECTPKYEGVTGHDKVSFQIQTGESQFFALVHGHSLDVEVPEDDGGRTTTTDSLQIPESGKLFELPYAAKHGTWEAAWYRRSGDDGGCVIRVCHESSRDLAPNIAAFLGKNTIKKDVLSHQAAVTSPSKNIACMTFYPWRVKAHLTDDEEIIISPFRVGVMPTKRGRKGFGGGTGRRHRKTVKRQQRLGSNHHGAPMGCISLSTFGGFYSRCEMLSQSSAQAKEFLAQSKLSLSNRKVARAETDVLFLPIGDETSHGGISLLQEMVYNDDKWQSESVVAMVLATLDPTAQELMALDGE